MPIKHRIEFEQVFAPITEPVTKFGGQPVWIAEPQWPLSRETGNPMRFICQVDLSVLLPKPKAQMAYLFLTDEDDGEYVDGTWEPNGGENAVILQPGIVGQPTNSLLEGPSLYRMVAKPGQDRLQPEGCEFVVRLIEEEDVEFVPEMERWQLPEAEATAAKRKLDENKIGGTPVFLQGDEFPYQGRCRLLLQLDACSVPFFVNFGDSGVGYAFLNEAGDEAKFLWQCC